MTTPLYVRRETAPISVRIRARRHPCYPVVYTTNCDARKAGRVWPAGWLPAEAFSVTQLAQYPDGQGSIW